MVCISYRSCLDSGFLRRLHPVVVCLFHEEKEENESSSEENGRPVKHPPPSLVFCDEATDDRRKVITPSQRKGVYSHICTALVSEVLANGIVRAISELLNILNSQVLTKLVSRVTGELNLTMSVTEISGRASIGEMKNPCRIDLAIHSPSLLICALWGEER